MSILPLTCKFKFIIQARTNSKRLPGKIFKTIGEKPLLLHIIDRLLIHQKRNEICFAIPENDQELIEFLQRENINYIEGNEKNVLSRYIKSSSELEDNDYIFRLTADNPFIDYKKIEILKEHIIKTKPEYTYSIGLPLGMGSEAVNVKVLRSLTSRALKEYHKEHVTVYFRENNDIFNILPVTFYNKNYNKKIRLTIDEDDDLKTANGVFTYFKAQNHPCFCAEDVIMLYNKDKMIFTENETVQQKLEISYEK
ncbi:MAG: hypothetical protein OEZ22_00640 [Spirochaetia bacterium]|nr:hypothetical protein [Spirochaetia bacterium]